MEFYIDIPEEEFNREEWKEFDRDFTPEERKEMRQLVFAWNEGVQQDESLSGEAKDSAVKVHEMAQRELKKTNSVLDFMIHADRTMNAMMNKFSMRKAIEYIQTSGIAVSLNTSLFTAWSAAATGGGRHGVTVDLITFAGIEFGIKAFTSKE